MAITYPLTLPTSGITSAKLRQRNATVQSQSPLTYSQEVYSFPGQAWALDVQLYRMERAEALNWVGFLSSLKGQLGTFEIGDPSAANGPEGEGGGTPLVNGASQTGNTLAIDGASASQTGWLKRGDVFEVTISSKKYLHMVMADADTNGSGQVTMDIWPDLRASPADNAAIVLTAPKGTFRLATNTQEWDIDQFTTYEMAFSAVEAIP